MKNKLIALVSLITLFISCISPISSYAYNESLMFDMQALGVLKGVELRNREDEGITRAEFIQIVANIMNIAPADGQWNMENRFSDIAESKFSYSINTMYDIGIINGSGDSKFNPDNKILLTEGLKILVNMLGYNGALSDQSLSSYYSLAAKIGLLHGVETSSDIIDTKSLLALINNALDVEILTFSYYTGDRSLIKSDDTYRQRLMKNKDYTIQKLKGVVTADSTTYLNTKIVNLKRNQLEIEGKIYDFEGDAPIDLVGIYIEFYQRYYNDGTQEVFSWRISEDNDIYHFTSNEILETTATAIKLESETVEISNDTKYIYNGRLDKDWTIAKLNNLKNSSFVFIDNNKDSLADVVFVWEYQNRVVERVYDEEDLVYFKASDSHTQRYLSLDIEDDEHYVSIKNSDGSTLAFSEIQPNMVLSLAISRDGEAINAVACTETVKGTLAEINEDIIKIDENEYYYDLDISNIRVGDEIKVLLNFQGIVVYNDKFEATENYGYVYDIQMSKGLSSKGSIKMLIPGPVAVKYIENEDITGGESTKTPKLFARNEAVEVFEIASKVSINGTATSQPDKLNDLRNRMVKYELDSSGKIYVIDFLTPIGSAPTKYYNANELIFGQTDGTAFGITQNETRAICIPINENPSDDDLKVFIELFHGVRYNVVGYEVDEDTNISDIIVISAEMYAGTPGIVNTSSTVAMVANTKTIVQDDEIRIIVTLIHDKEEHEYLVSNLIPNQSSFSTLKKGDIIAFSLDGFDFLNGFSMLQKADNYNDFIINANTDNELFCGVVSNIAYKYASPVKNRWVNGYALRFSDDSQTVATYEAFIRGNTPVFVIEQNGDVRSGSYDDILYGSRVFFAVTTGKVRAISVKK